MKHTQANLGRIFILRLEHGDQIPDTIEEFAKTHQIESAMVLFLGGADKGSKVVVGPEENTTGEVLKMVTTLFGVVKQRVSEPYSPIRTGSPNCISTPPSAAGYHHRLHPGRCNRLAHRRGYHHGVG